MLTAKWLKNLIGLRQTDDEQKGKELILNILLWFSLVGFLILNIIRVTDVLTRPDDRGLPLIYTLAMLGIFIGLLALSRRGYLKTAAWSLISIYSLPMLYSFWAWGTDLPAAILLAILIITLSGILINGNMVIISTTFISALTIILTALQNSGVINVNTYWHTEKREIGDAVANAVLLAIIAAIAWLFCREIGRTLKRAKQSEAALREERDRLEITVTQRTAQLREAEAEKINQLYRLAEFGRLSSGIFHDLINPLTAVSLNLEQVKDENKNGLAAAKSYLNQALLATHKMEGLIAGIKKQLQTENPPEIFKAIEETKQIIEILTYQARRALVKITLRADPEIPIYGEAIKFGQIILNLLANAIEASEAGENPKNNLPAEVMIELRAIGGQAIITVSDHGTGILPENLDKIFQPFFSTKKGNGRGLGLGLSSTKEIIEKNFHGTITVASEYGRGSRFTVSLPLTPKND